MFLTRLLRLDAVANLAGGAGLAAASGLLAPALGLTAPWPLVAVGVALVAYGELQWVVARRAEPGKRAVGAVIAVDLLFAVAVLDLALANPFGADPWARWLLAAVADLSALVGLAKWYGLRQPLAERTLHSADDALGVQL
jgi:ABC-type sulfate transport system permease component